MSFLRTAPTRRLLAVLGLVLLVAVAGATIAIGASSGGTKPPAKPLAQATRDALTAPKVAGITARIKFTNKLIDSSSIQAGGPLLSGATGRLWVGAGHKLRLELQSDNGDAQIVADGRTAWVYDSGSNTVYRGTLPSGMGRDKGSKREHGREKLPSVKEIEQGIAKLMKRVNLSGAKPSNVAGRPAYTVRISPKHDGGLLGAGEIAWDAARGLPLRAAVYAQGSSTPVLELEATEISYRTVAASTFAVAPPKGAKVVALSGRDGKAEGSYIRHSRERRGHKRDRAVTSPAAVAAKLPFHLSAPDTLAGLPRHGVRLLNWKGHPAALVFYGRNLGGIAVVEQSAREAKSDAKKPHGRRGEETQLPSVSINGATGHELDTALGTVLTFERGGIAYTVLGSVPPAAAEAAARGL